MFGQQGGAGQGLMDSNHIEKLCAAITSYAGNHNFPSLISECCVCGYEAKSWSGWDVSHLVCTGVGTQTKVGTASGNPETETLPLALSLDRTPQQK